MIEQKAFDELSEELRRDLEKGDRSALLQMVYHAAQHRRPLPEWAAEAFPIAYTWVMRGSARTWDDAFGPPFPAGTHIHKLKLESRRYEVYQLVQEIHRDEGCPIDDELFERVGREMGIGGKTTIKDLYGPVARALRWLVEDGHVVADAPQRREK
jgi:hypothetical protein